MKGTSPRPRRIGSASVAALFAIGAACGAALPREVRDAQADLRSPSARSAKRDAPGDLARAERTLERARKAAEDGRDEEASRLGALARAQIELAITNARARSAERRIADAERRIAEARREQERHETARAAEERRIQVLEREAEARRILEQERQRAESEESARAKRLPASEQRLREGAMRAAAGEARVRARMICLAGRTLADDAAAFDTSVGPAREAAERAASGNDPAADLSAALAYRDACVRALDRVRVAARAGAEEREAVEAALFAAASEKGGLDPRRDERGVVLTLRRLFTRASTIGSPGRAMIEKVVAVVGDRPIRIVVEAHGATEALTVARAEAVGAALASLGIDRARIATAGFGQTRPLLVTGGRGRPDPRDERVEVVLVAGGIGRGAEE